MKQLRFEFFVFISILLSIFEAQASDYDNEFNILNYFELKEHHLISPDLTNINNLICKYINNGIFIFSRQRRITKKNELQYIYLIENSVEKKIVFSSPDNDWILDFYVSKEKLYLLGDNNLYIFDLVANPPNLDLNTFFVKSINTNKEFRKIKVENNQIILSESCFGCTKKGMRVLILNENDGDNKIITYHEFKTPLGFQFDFYQPTSWLDACNGYYLKSEVLDYHIVIYNSRFDSINCISRTLPSFDYNKRYEFEDTSFFINLYNPVDGTFKCDSLEKITNRIQLVKFLNDTSILVCYSFGSEIFSNLINRYYYDIWNYNSSSDQWELCKSELMNLYSFWENDLVNWKYMVIGLLLDYQISNGKIFKFITMPYSFSEIDTTKVTYKQLYDMKTDFMNKNGKRLTLLVYELKP